MVSFQICKVFFASVMSTRVCARVCVHVCVCVFNLLQLHGFSPTVFQAVASHWGHQDFSSTALCPPCKTPWETHRWWELCSLFTVRYRWETQTVFLIMVGWLGHTLLFMRNSVLTPVSLPCQSPLRIHARYWSSVGIGRWLDLFSCSPVWRTQKPSPRVINYLLNSSSYCSFSFQ